MNGWIKINRSLTSHWIFSFDEPDKSLAWIDLLMMARHKDGSTMLKGRVQEIKRGQVAMSQIALQKRWGWSQNKVKRFLKLLKNERMVVIETNDLTTLVTICNYSDFQGDEQADERPNERPDERPDERATNDQTNDDVRKKERKEVNNTPLTPLGGKSTKNEASKTKRFKPPSVEEVAIHCKTRGNSIDAQQFWHHYEANGWMVGKNKMKSWKSALITWEKNSYAANKQDSRNSGQSNHGSITVDHTDTNWGFAD